MQFRGVNIVKRKARVFGGTAESSVSNRKKTPASLYTHRMVYENGTFIGREPIIVTSEDEGTTRSE